MNEGQLVERKNITGAVANPIAANIFCGSPQERVAVAESVANVLKPLLQKQNLTVAIGNTKKEHVKSEGWAVLGSLLGVYARERDVKRHDDGTWEAHVDLIRADTGHVFGGGSSICSPKESRWRGRDDFAIRSMAITRATGRAFKQSFGWVMDIAGYSNTVFEEVDGQPDFEESKPNVNLYTATDAQKVRLKEVAVSCGLLKKEDWIALNELMNGKPMVQLRTVCLQYFASQNREG